MRAFVLINVEVGKVLSVRDSLLSARFAAVVEAGPLMATQFHPEKSGDAGARLLRNWLETL